MQERKVAVAVLPGDIVDLGAGNVYIYVGDHAWIDADGDVHVHRHWMQVMKNYLCARAAQIL